MERAFNFLRIIIFLTILIYLVGFVISDEFLNNFIKEVGPKLAPYGIEILHLR
ncbi:MAG: hypothetical protein NZ866_00395 [Patescibacteria group bacterium]|nr:hypothetical protein [Patescibacteria group bacterium]